jgi:hypothetical protein
MLEQADESLCQLWLTQRFLGEPGRLPRRLDPLA